MVLANRLAIRATRYSYSYSATATAPRTRGVVVDSYGTYRVASALFLICAVRCLIIHIIKDILLYLYIYLYLTLTDIEMLLYILRLCLCRIMVHMW